jgi:hypothetical protein
VFQGAGECPSFELTRYRKQKGADSRNHRKFLGIDDRETACAPAAVGVLVVAIYRLLQNSPFGPAEIKRMTDAYEHALHALRITDRSHPMNESIAMKIIAITQTGEHDPQRIAARAIKELGIPMAE